MTTANLSATINVYWHNTRGYQRECEVEVEYAFDGVTLDSLRIKSARAIEGDDYYCDTLDFDDQVWETIADRAFEDYAEWLADDPDRMPIADGATVPGVVL